jgi:hypothetical protein
MKIDLPDDLPFDTVARMLKTYGLGLDGKVPRDGVHRVYRFAPGQCCETGCTRKTAVNIEGRCLCAHHALEKMGRDAGV